LPGAALAFTSAKWRNRLGKAYLLVCLNNWRSGLMSFTLKAPMMNYCFPSTTAPKLPDSSTAMWIISTLYSLNSTKKHFYIHTRHPRRDDDGQSNPS